MSNDSGRMVPDSGSFRAQIGFLGESPGSDEVDKGENFVGRSGQELRQWIQLAGIDPELCWYGNVCQEQPEGNDFARIPQHSSYAGPPRSPQDYDSNGRLLPSVLYHSGACGWLGDVHRRLAALPNLSVLVAVGAWPSRLILRNPSIKILKNKGDVHRARLDNGKDIWVVCLPHPSGMLHAGDSKNPFFLRFLCPNYLVKARRLASGSKPELPILDSSGSYRESRTILKTMLADMIAMPNMPVAIDLETTGRTIDTISFGYRWQGIMRGYAIGFQGFPQACYSESEEWELWSLIARILELPNPKIGHNFQYDLRFLADRGLGVRNVWWDTLWAMHVRSPASEGWRGLEDLASLTWVPYYKDDRQPLGNIPLELRWEYAARDGAVTALVQELQEMDFRRSPALSRAFHELSMPQLIPFLRAEIEGMPIDKDTLRKRSEELDAELGPLLTKLTSLRYGTDAWEHWKNTYELACSTFGTWERRLESGGATQSCSSCGGSGLRVYKKRVSSRKKSGSETETPSVCTTCRKCDGSGKESLKKWKSLRQYFQRSLKEYEKKEPRTSPKQQDFKTWIYSPISEGGLGLPTMKRSKKTDKASFDEESRQKIKLRLKREQFKTAPHGKKMERLNFQMEVLDLVQEIEDRNIEQSNFARGLLERLSPDGRFRNQVAPLENTARSHSREDAYGDGRNYQNFPRVGHAKKSLLAPPGHIWIEFDYVQAEAVLAHWDSGDRDYVERILSLKSDVHSEATEIALGIKRENYDPTVWKTLYRQVGKRLKHGFTYLMGKRKAWEQAVLDLEKYKRDLVSQGYTNIPDMELTEAQVDLALLNLAYKYPLVENRKRDIINYVRKHRKLHTIFGRTFFFYGEWESHFEKVGLALRPQNGVADILNIGGGSGGWVAFHHHWWQRDRRVSLLGQKHDAAAWLCPGELVWPTIGTALRCWGGPFWPCDPGEAAEKGPIVIPMEFSIGNTLGDMRELRSFNKAIDWLGMYKEACSNGKMA